jgi:hypothetical protein
MVALHRDETLELHPQLRVEEARRQIVEEVQHWR